MFLLFLASTFVVVHGIICKEFDNKIFLLVLSVLFIYGITMHLFPYIQPQYIDKGRLVLTVGEFVSSNMYLDIVYKMSQLFYTRIFVDGNIIDITIWSGFIYGVVRFSIFFFIQLSNLASKLKSKMKNKGLIPRNPLFTLPIIGGISNISHSVLATPFWIGPQHTFFSIFALSRIDRKSLAFLISALLVTILPGSQVESYTGSLREIIYLFLIIPI